ncbi:hypothetical protein PDIG_83610 [Penicillium digitatum PHI26]|uniref:Uncharacterized protein n=2 Tax=Penicillium digitatum TaxID=36651 RepID=K9FBH7_PEND2|nr:hypothetical protein PDIP_89110 [Penicillium digitatum Pd1]EKV04052.1 hypothetical protein PDIP_89110 [Penicillium digitatum Pd1]EKV05382.1 hypothetical protein PDIG_83610 [Penicillium digitatum PHI26]
MATEPHLFGRAYPERGLQQADEVEANHGASPILGILNLGLWNHLDRGKTNTQTKEIAYLHDVEQPEVVKHSSDAFVHDSFSRDSHVDGVLVLDHFSKSMRWKDLLEKYSRSVKWLTGKAVQERVWC